MNKSRKQFEKETPECADDSDSELYCYAYKNEYIKWLEKDRDRLGVLFRIVARWVMENADHTEECATTEGRGEDCNCGYENILEMII